MAKKRTPEDSVFAERFAIALLDRCETEKQGGKHTEESFALTVGINRTQLYNYRDNGQVPSIRTVALAFALYGIAIPYDGVDFTKALAGNGKKKVAKPDNQLELPFSLRSTGVNQAMEISFKRKSPRRVDVFVKIRKANA